jgi:hypothetical protein
MFISNVLGYDVSGDDVVLGHANTIQSHENVEEILGDVSLGSCSEQPILLAALVGFDLDTDTLRGIGVRGKNVDPASVPKGQRGDVSSTRQFRCDKILASNS